MIPYRLPQEKETLLHYADLLNDPQARLIIENDAIRSTDEAIHLAQFFWRMADQSNIEDAKSASNSEYILEKIIITLMAYFRSSGYEEEWEKVSDERS